MRRLFTILTLSLTSGILAVCNPIVGSAFQSNCSAGGSSVAGGASCLADPSGTVSANYLPAFGTSYAYSSATVTSTIATSATGYSELHAVQTTKLGQGWSSAGSNAVPAASATSQVQFGEYLTTTGPVRNGLLQIILTNNNQGNPTSGSGTGSFSLSLLPTNLKGYGQANALGCGISFYSCSDAMLANHYDNQGGFMVALGTTFYLSYSGLLQSYTGGYTDGNGSGTLDLDFQFRFLEADGVTPVGVGAAAPEPSTFGMLAASIGTAVALWRRRRA